MLDQDARGHFVLLNHIEAINKAVSIGTFTHVTWYILDRFIHCLSLYRSQNTPVMNQ